MRPTIKEIVITLKSMLSSPNLLESVNEKSSITLYNEQPYEQKDMVFKGNYHHNKFFYE